MSKMTDVLIRALVFRKAGLFPAKDEKLGVSAAGALVWDASATPAVDLGEQNVEGRYYHVLDLTAGGDTFKVQGDCGLGLRDITGLTGLATDGQRQFTGVYKTLKVVRTAGTGTTSKAFLISQA